MQFTHHNIRLDDGTFTKPDFGRSMVEYLYFKSARGILENMFPGDKSQLEPNIAESFAGGSYQANLRGMFIGIKS